MQFYLNSLTFKSKVYFQVESGLEESEKSIYTNKFKDFLDEKVFFKTMIELVKPTEPMAVLGHGDFWNNNMMFRYSDNEEVSNNLQYSMYPNVP